MAVPSCIMLHWALNWYRAEENSEGNSEVVAICSLAAWAMLLYGLSISADGQYVTGITIMVLVFIILAVGVLSEPQCSGEGPGDVVRAV